MALPTQLPGGRSHVGLGWRHPHYAQLLRECPALDFLEVHSENFFAEGGAALGLLLQARAQYPISLHGVGLSLGAAAGLDPWHLDQLATLVARIEPVRVSDHAAFARAPYAGATVHGADLLPLPFNDAALDVLSRNVEQVQERLRRPILVENLSAYVQWRLPPAERAWHEADFLNRLAARTGCALLVDVNNIYVNALNAHTSDPGAHCRAWLEALQPSVVGEIHLAGHQRVQEPEGEIVIDDHGSRVCAAVWDLFAHCNALWGPRPSLLEWDTDIPAMAVLLDEVQRARHVQCAQASEVLA